MKPPREHWALQIDITNACHLHCSNCTRALDHAKPRFFMSPECFRQTLLSARGFLKTPAVDKRRKVIGIIGGEPLLHPQFPELVDIFCELVPEVYFRGLWTSKDFINDSHPKWGPYLPQVEKLIGKNPRQRPGQNKGPSEKHKNGFLNWNTHHESLKVHHQPILTASDEMVPNEAERWELIEACWVQNSWSSTYTDRGYFFCEVAGALDQVFKNLKGKDLPEEHWPVCPGCHGVGQHTGHPDGPDGCDQCQGTGYDVEFLKSSISPGGLPIADEDGNPLEPWNGELDFINVRYWPDDGTTPPTNPDQWPVMRQPIGPFAEQIKALCSRCGACLPMKGRRDCQEIDDVTPANLALLEAAGSPRVKKGAVKVHQLTLDGARQPKHWNPKQYVKGHRPVDQHKL